MILIKNDFMSYPNCLNQWAKFAKLVLNWPKNKKFAFAIVDDTDHGTVANLTPIYDLLDELEIKCTKTTWVYPTRDKYTGESLQDEHYLNFVKMLQSKGHEIALHNIGSGSFKREEIELGLKDFEEKLGHKPSIHVNHSKNQDNLFWGSKRFIFPIRQMMSLKGAKQFFGDDSGSDHYWTDLASDNIQYMRNHVYNQINTGAADPHMPYQRGDLSRHNWKWFSSSDAGLVDEFLNLLQPHNIQSLENDGGFCIIYTHFGTGFTKNGQVKPMVEAALRNLANHNAWFPTTTELLDYLSDSNSFRNRGKKISYLQQLRLDIKWLIQRLQKRMKYGR